MPYVTVNIFEDLGGSHRIAGEDGRREKALAWEIIYWDPISGCRGLPGYTTRERDIIQIFNAIWGQLWMVFQVVLVTIAVIGTSVSGGDRLMKELISVRIFWKFSRKVWVLLFILS